MKPVPPFNHIIPRRRDRNGDSIARHYVWSPPLPHLNPLAPYHFLAEVAKDPRSFNLAWARLWARNCATHQQACLDLDQNQDETREQQNRFHQVTIASSQLDLPEAKARRDKAKVELGRLLPPLGIAFHPEDASLSFHADEPVSLETIAGMNDLDPPERQLGFARRLGYQLAASLGGGIPVGLGLGVLSRTIDPERPDALLSTLWALVGIMIMTLHGVVRLNFRSVGMDLYRVAKTSERVRAGYLTTRIVYGAVWMLLAVLIESVVMQAGLYAALSADSSLKGSAVDSFSIFVASVAIGLPVTLAYAALGVLDGWREANLMRLLSLQSEARDKARATRQFAHASAVFMRYRCWADRVKELEASIQKAQGALRFEKTSEEKLQHDDMAQDDLGYADRLEEALDALRPQDETSPKPQDQLKTSEPPAWLRFALVGALIALVLYLVGGRL